MTQVSSRHPILRWGIRNEHSPCLTLFAFALTLSTFLPLFLPQVCLTVIKACALESRWAPTRTHLALLRKDYAGAHAALVHTLDQAIDAKNVKAVLAAVLAVQMDTSGAVV
jgi:hypothetical protein